MSFDADNSDLRHIRTKKSISSALLALLEYQNFKKVTVKEICEEALISRVTFYAHYTDKYDLLKSALIGVRDEYAYKFVSYSETESIVNRLARENAHAIKNVVDNADNETLDILYNFILALLNVAPEQYAPEKRGSKHAVYTNFIAGGMFQYVLWHVKNKFPLELMNIHLYEMITKLREWESQ